MKSLIINTPKIQKSENGYKIISKIEYENNKKYDMWFEVEENYGKYLCSENLDAFLIALLPLIVRKEYSVKVIGNISSRLYYQLTNYLLPLLCKEFNKNKINIECSLSDELYNGDGVGASISCGVDSFYTLLKHTNQEDSKYNITHLTYFNAGSHGENGGDKAREKFHQRLIAIKKLCNEYNYNLVIVDSNMNELIKMDHESTNTFRTLACVLVLQKLFCKYYFASCCSFNGSHIDEYDTTHYDILNVQCLSNENITFYCSGLEVNRQQKIEFISKFPITYKWLNVCTRTINNCGECEKCIRTMTALESIGELQNYSEVFDLEKYEKNKFKYYVKIYRYNRDKMKKEFYEPILKSYKQNGIKIPATAYLISLIPNYYSIKTLLKNILPKKALIFIKTKILKIKLNGNWTN